MFASPALAQVPGAAGSAGATAFFLQVAPLLFIFVIFYFLLIRPQQRRMKQHRDMVAAVKKGDTVVTAGGLIGRVTRVDEAEVELELGANTKVRAVKSTLSEVRTPGGKPAND